MGDEYYDEAVSLKQEVVARTPDMVRQRQAVMAALALNAGESVLDVGSGNGILAREMLNAVGPSGSVIGVDPAEPMIAMSRTLCPGATFHQGNASALPVASEAFDAVTASQVLGFVPDVDTALAEMHRVLRFSGRLVILDTDWQTLLWNCSDSELLEKVITELTSPYTSAHVPRTLSAKLVSAGFELVDRKVHPIVNWNLSEESYSAQLTSFLPTREEGNGRRIDLRSAWNAEQTRMNNKGEYLFSLNRYIFTAQKR
ncbi:MAG: methyltransferase domain-containing protein [Pseudomonadota bacterium]